MESEHEGGGRLLVYVSCAALMVMMLPMLKDCAPTIQSTSPKRERIVPEPIYLSQVLGEERKENQK
jgi:hypothetical protein